MIRKILMLTVCCLWFGVAYSQIHYDITGTYENGAGKKVHLVVIENGNIEGWRSIPLSLQMTVLLFYEGR